MRTRHASQALRLLVALATCAVAASCTGGGDSTTSNDAKNDSTPTSPPADGSRSPSSTSSECPPPLVGRKENGECAAVGEYGVMLGRSLCCAACGPDEIAVRRGVPTCVPKPKDAGPPPTCGVTLFGPQSPPSCELALDDTCCDEQQACAADPACASLVACIAACDPANKSACVNACSETAPPPTLSALLTCSKSTDAGACPYP